MATIRGSQSYVWDTSKFLGQGATSAVYMGRNKKTGEEVAVKVFNAQSYHRPFTVQTREFEVMKKLNHDNVVKLLAIEEEMPSRSRVIVMEFCTHGSLYNMLDQSENSYGLAEDEFLSVLSQVTAGVKHLRDFDIIHRDIKPGNILRSVAPDGRSVFKLTDFGAARELQPEEEFISLYGTDEYLHPDMYEKAVLRKGRGQQFGGYVDLWSLGVTFYHAATGNLPFRPYGGRKNKETMHMITARKEHGVISGVQEQAGGQVRWSRDLPLTCKLSRGLKTLITPFLADLLEKDVNKTMSYEEFFSRVDDIKGRIPYHVFCPFSYSQLIMYTKPGADMSQLQQLITDQTEIPGGAQLLLHDGKVLRNESRDPVDHYLKHVSADNPIFVFNKLPEYKRFIKPEYGTFMEISQETSVDTDYHICKRNYAVLHSMKNVIKLLVQNNQLMTKAVKMYSMYVRQKSTQSELSMGHVTRQCSDSKAWKDQLFTSLANIIELLKIIAKSNVVASGFDVMGRISMLQTLSQTGSRECSQINAQLQSRLDKASALLQDIKPAQTDIDADWNPNVGCLPSDRCIEKIEFMLQKLHKILGSFREDRSKRQLNNNDEQIHRFDKNKMKELCIMAQTLVDDDCKKRGHNLFKAFQQCYSKAVQIHDAGETLDRLIAEIPRLQGRLVDKLKVSGKQCVTQSETIIQAIGPAEGLANGTVTNSGDNTGTNSVNGGGSLGSRQDKLGSVLDSIHSTTSVLEEVRALVTENTSLMERFNSLGEPQEEDKSWEYVP